MTLGLLILWATFPSPLLLLWKPTMLLVQESARLRRKQDRFSDQPGNPHHNCHQLEPHLFQLGDRGPKSHYLIFMSTPEEEHWFPIRPGARGTQRSHVQVFTAEMDNSGTLSVCLSVTSLASDPTCTVH